MRRMIAVAALTSLVGCAEEPPPLVEPMPLAMETYADPEDPNVQACLTVVSRNTGIAGVVATGIASGPEGNVVTVLGDGRRWHCHVTDGGMVTSMLPV